MHAATLGRKAALSAAIALVITARTDVTAQEDALEEVVVTGSRIARRDFSAQSPIVTVDADSFNARTNVGIEATLNQLPQFTVAGTQASTSAASTPFPQANAAPGAASRGPLGHRLARLQRRRQSLHRGKSGRDPVEGARPAQQPRQPGSLVEPQWSPRRPQPLRVGEQREDALAEGLVGTGPLVAALHLRAGVLDDPVVLHARRAGGHAGHAAEAGVDVLH